MLLIDSSLATVDVSISAWSEWIGSSSEARTGNCHAHTKSTIFAQTADGTSTQACHMNVHCKAIHAVLEPIGGARQSRYRSEGLIIILMTTLATVVSVETAEISATSVMECR